MQLPTKLTDSTPIYSVTDPSDNSATVTYNVGPAWLVVYALPFLAASAFLWSITAFIYWFVFVYGVVAGIV
jgi:hypothetical protein